jgi:hypothetical protein
MRWNFRPAIMRRWLSNEYHRDSRREVLTEASLAGPVAALLSRSQIVS